jgi:hypothetical protein
MSRALLVLGLAGLGACWRATPPPTPPQRLAHEVRQILGRDEPSPRFYRERGRLEAMGVELEPVLVWLVNDRDADETVRANALLLLADRGSPAAPLVLRRVLLADPDETLRSSAVFGLQRFAANSPEAATAIRAAIDDPSRRVRMSVLQALDVEDVALIRALLAREEDPQVRSVARELVALAESRGAPLPRETDGTYRTTSQGGVQIVFQPTWSDTLSGVEVGALWVETSRPRLLPLAQTVEAVNGVVPAYFSRDRTWVVYETERVIRLHNLKTGEVRDVGRGIAPRVIPFTDRFVYLEEVPGLRRSTAGGTELTYEVLRVPFGAGVAERMGRLQVVARPERHGNASPARWMVIGETPEGFALRGDGMRPFLLPIPFPASPPTRPTRPARPPRGQPE